MAEIHAEQNPEETFAREQLGIGATAVRSLADVIEYVVAHGAGEWDPLDREVDALNILQIARGETTSHEIGGRQ
ncbi:hypothetical protein [Microbacterium sp. ZXX196]|uniref:hypothetical protein n=1 Tax=Microbacterium sp. ZXX196 TaxID=2609291 RepID=UPI0012B6B1AC|nr:hypothetical protein [Microbacterium sp. ZXX196]MTE24847.1 hypothetical protein [Microbacterium sp. ZXX196]